VVERAFESEDQPDVLFGVIRDRWVGDAAPRSRRFGLMVVPGKNASFYVLPAPVETDQPMFEAPQRGNRPA
jgi:hypothetical protein